MMKKLLVSAALVFAMSSSCFAAKIDQPATSSKIFQDSEYKISVQLPEGFDYADDDNEGVVIAASDKKGGTYNIVAQEVDHKLMEAGTDKEKLGKLTDGFKDEYTKKGLEIYHDYIIKINPDRFGFFMEGYNKGGSESGKNKTSIIKFYHNDKLFTVTLKAPYEKKGYLKNFKRFRTSITCKN